MVPALFEKRELKLRRKILQGVYEDNLRVLGRGRYRPERRKSFLLKRLLLVVMTFLGVMLLNGDYLADLIGPARRITADAVISRLPTNLSHSPSNERQNLKDLGAFMNAELSIGRVFGLGVKSIMIDPGHGGSDAGARGAMGAKEKALTLDIAQRLRHRLLRHGFFNVLLTRDGDTTVPLNKRVEAARAAKADLFISIHLNYLPFNSGNIIETYFFGPTTDGKALELARRENSGSDYALSDFKEMIGKLGEKLKLQESKDFAETIQRNLFFNRWKRDHEIEDSGVKRAPFVVLLGVDVPAVLAEVSCLSNSKEESELGKETHREHIAASLEAGILDYLHQRGDVIYDATRTASTK
jgi:N-acetylmuramoyl-L-alanine amidase